MQRYARQPSESRYLRLTKIELNGIFVCLIRIYWRLGARKSSSSSRHEAAQRLQIGFLDRRRAGGDQAAVLAVPRQHALAAVERL